MGKHNVLFITGDHVRSDVLRATDGTRCSTSLADYIKTPHLDALAQEGTAFRNCFTPCPLCVPARAAITTGRYPHKSIGCKSNNGMIHAEQPRLADHFSQHGYRTYAIGKLHYIPYAPPGKPRLLHGFDEAELCEEGRIVNQHGPDGRRRGLEDYHDFVQDMGWRGYERSHGIGNNDVRPGLTIMPAECHEEAWVAQRTIHHLAEHQKHSDDTPFFMWMSFTKPHPPYDPPAPYDRMYDPRSFPTPLGTNIPDILKDRDRELNDRVKQYGWDSLSPEAVQRIRAAYAGLITFQDAMIGRVLSQLKQAGLYENTIIVYTSDHGDLLGDFGRFFKTCMFDASVKVPLIIRTPSDMDAKHGQCVDQFVGLQDLLPTFCDLADIDVPEGMDGDSLLGILKDPDASGHSMYISQSNDSPTQKYMVRTERWKYVYTQVDGIEELYDMHQSDAELVNLAINPTYKQQLKTLRQTLIDWCEQHADHAMVHESRLAVSSQDELPKNYFRGGPLGLRKY